MIYMLTLSLLLDLSPPARGDSVVLSRPQKRCSLAMQVERADQVYQRLGQRKLDRSLWQYLLFPEQSLFNTPPFELEDPR